MTILFVHQNLGAFGGAETNISLTGRELKRRGHNVGLLYSRRTGLGEETWAETFPFRRQIDADYPHTSVSAALREFAPDVIYLNTMPDLRVLKSVVASDVPVVRMVHDHEMYCLRGCKYNYVTRRICTRPASLYCVFPCMGTVARNRGGLFPLRWASYFGKLREIRLNRRCKEFVVYSDYSRQELIRNGFPESRIHIHIPIEASIREAATSSFSDRNLILYVGQIIRGKGVDFLLRALALVGLRFECLILGDGNHRQQCERLSRRLRLDSCVRFGGFVTQTELRKYYLDASLLAVSSVWPEPFGMVGPEAMRYGLPVVAFDAGGIREWLSNGENGFLVPWCDTAAYARSIERLLSDKTLGRRLGTQGSRRVEAEYHPNRQIQRLEHVFRSVAGEAPERRVDVPRFVQTAVTV